MAQNQMLPCLTLITFCPKGPPEFNFILVDLNLRVMLPWSVGCLLCTDPGFWPYNLLEEVAETRNNLFCFCDKNCPCFQTITSRLDENNCTLCSCWNIFLTPLIGGMALGCETSLFIKKVLTGCHAIRYTNCDIMTCCFSLKGMWSVQAGSLCVCGSVWADRCKSVMKYLFSFF